MKGKNKSWYVLELASSIIMVSFLLILLWFSVKYWQNNYRLVKSFDAQMFSIGMLVAIVTVLAQWIEGRIKSIDNSINALKGGGKHARNRR